MLTVTIANPNSDLSDGQLLRRASTQLIEICLLAIELGCHSVQVRSGELMPPPFDPSKVLQLSQAFAGLN